VATAVAEKMSALSTEEKLEGSVKRGDREKLSGSLVMARKRFQFTILQMMRFAALAATLVFLIDTRNQIFTEFVVFLIVGLIIVDIKRGEPSILQGFLLIVGMASVIYSYSYLSHGSFRSASIVAGFLIAAIPNSFYRSVFRVTRRLFLAVFSKPPLTEDVRTPVVWRGFENGASDGPVH